MSADQVQSFAPPNHFSLVLGRIAHARIGRHSVTLCGRQVGDYPVVAGLTADEVLRRADCKTCKGVIRP